MRPAAKREDVDVDVDADAAARPLAVVEALSDGARTGVLGGAERRVTVIPLPLRLIAARYTRHIHPPRAPSVHDTPNAWA